MKYGLSVAYISLLLISLISSCLLFLIVASEAIKPNYEHGNNRDIKSSSFVVTVNDIPVTGDHKDKKLEVSDDFVDKVAAGDPPPSLVPGAPGDIIGDGGDADQFVSEIVDAENIGSGVVHADQLSLKNAAITGMVASDVDEKILPDIPANPAVITLGDKAPELIIESHLDDTENEYIESVDKNNNQSSDDTTKSFIQSDFVLLPEVKSFKDEVVLQPDVPPDENLPKIDDSGGTVNYHYTESIQDVKDPTLSLHDDEHISTSDIPISSTEGAAPTISPEVNLTVEENPIPVFSEWAQKQMEEAEKKLEKQVVNSSSMKKNTVAGSKPQPLKLRAKNYASPDCGAKIIASNSDAQNTGALLTASKDEYMLSPCTNRIWFVVELCEAIQAEKIDFANFELFSSSPENFSVAVSNRFPTREWSNVGRFIADDERNIQSFELFPHLFGKFVRVDIHSHYNSEHFCPISLFRVYGTSEFEAFETENRLPADDIDEFDDEETVEQGSNHLKNENNLFKSASDAVMSIVKKAAEVLVKNNSNKTDTDASILNSNDPKMRSSYDCFTLRNTFSCDKCGEATVNRINYLLSCKYNQLISLLSIETLRVHIITSQICANRFSLDTTNLDNLACKQSNNRHHLTVDEKQSYILSSFPIEYIAAMCHILTTNANNKRNSSYHSSGGGDTALNLTIDQKSGSQFININSANDRHSKKVLKEKLPKLSIGDQDASAQTVDSIESSNNSETHGSSDEVQNSVTLENFNDIKTDDENDSKVIANDRNDVFTATTTQVPAVDGENQEIKLTTASNVNIFNVVEDVSEINDDVILPTTEDQSNAKVSDVFSSESTIDDGAKMRDSATPVDVEPSAWDNLEHMLADQVSSESLNAANADGIQASMYQTPQRVHSESVFLRLSNRIKALERNMSLSGQYLEELSRRYKKQVEELQHSFAKTLASIEEQNRRALEKEHILVTQNKNLKEELEKLSSRLNTWIIFGICFGLFLTLQTILLWLRSHQENKRILKHFEESSLVRKHRSTALRKLFRRKSLEGVSGHPSPCHKVRRPSEEAMRITGSYKNLLIDDDTKPVNIGTNDEIKDKLSEITNKRSKLRQRKISIFNSRRNGSLESKKLLFERQESAPGDYIRTNTVPITASQHDDKLILDEDYESYIPGSDLAYNEFMPDGPSGNQILSINGTISNSANGSKSITKKSSKVRRLSSPSFLKSPFTRSSNSGSKKSPHSPTGWEWYRLRKSEPKTNNTSSQSIMDSRDLKKSKSESPELSVKINGFGNSSSTPNSSISEMILNSTENGSDESIRTSGTSTTTGSLLSNGNRSSSKKHGSFRKIFKKVF